jgi:hypothetical protein
VGTFRVVNRLLCFSRLVNNTVLVICHETPAF